MRLPVKIVGPLSIFLAVSLGACVGVFFPGSSSSIAGVNDTLSNFLRMCVIPIVVSSLIVEITSFLRSAETSNIKKFISISLSVSLLFVLFSALLSFLFQPGKHTTFNNKSELAEKIIEASIIERSINDPIDQENQQNFFDFFSKAIPQNIFGAFSHNKTLQIIFFTVVFSIALASIPRSEHLHNFFRETRESFLKIFTYALKFLPLLVFTSTSLAVSKIGIQVFLDMMPFLKILFLQLAIIFGVNLWILHHRLRTSVGSILKQLETSMLVAFSGSVLAATFPALDFFKKFAEVDKQFIKIITPISMFLNTFGSILYFCFSCFFIGYHFTYEQILLIISFSILGGIASAGTTEGITSVLLVSILDLINLPAGQVVLVLSSLDFLVGPFLSIITVQTNIVVLSFLIPRIKKRI
jgi:proton glutamate symport protein